MSEKDPYAEKKRNENKEAQINHKISPDSNPDVSRPSPRKPQDDVNPVRPQTTIPGKKNKEREQETAPNM